MWTRFFDDTIRFSHKTGFYDEPFDLQIRTRPGLTLYYTLDGSDPTPASYLYEGSIHIDDPTDNPNVYSARTDTSQLFIVSLPEDIPCEVPDYNVDKCVPLRVASYDAARERINESVATYWIGYDEKDGYDGLYTISLITDPYGLFDYESGIYVTGLALDEHVKKEGGPYPEYYAMANYRLRGWDWERIGHASVFSPEGELICDSNAGLRIKGGGSRKNNQKSFKLYARDGYGGTNDFRISLFDRKGGMQKLVLHAGGQDEILKCDDYLVQSILRDGGFDFGTVEMLPASVFLDGEYWGVYYLSEDITGDYIDYHYGVARDNVIIIKNGEKLDGVESDWQFYNDLYDYVELHKNDADAYEHICSDYIDIDSFADYYAAEIYIGNNDWPRTNTLWWRSRESSDEKYNDGKWRFVLYDVNTAAVLNDAYDKTLELAMEDDELFSLLM